MAKSDSIFKFHGTISNLTFVRSRAYGDHVRAKRGTHKTAEVNEALKQANEKLISANIPAKIFKDAIDPYRSNIMGGPLWQRLLSMFRKQLKELGSIDFGKIERFDIHADYPFDRFLSIQPTLTVDNKNAVIHIDIHCSGKVRFAKSKYTNGYKLTIIGIFPDLEKKTAKTIASEGSVTSLTEAVSPLQAQLIIPSQAKHYIICIKIEGYTNGVANNMRTTTALCAIGSGTI